jgi:hypothetical protein
MEEIVLKYNQLNQSAKESLLDFLDFLIQKQQPKQVAAKYQTGDEWMKLVDKMGDNAQKNGLTQDILDEILNEK